MKWRWCYLATMKKISIRDMDDPLGEHMSATRALESAPRHRHRSAESPTRQSWKFWMMHVVSVDFRSLHRRSRAGLGSGWDSRKKRHVPVRSHRGDLGQSSEAVLTENGAPMVHDRWCTREGFEESGRAATPRMISVDIVGRCSEFWEYLEFADLELILRPAGAHRPIDQSDPSRSAIFGASGHSAR